ncbi:uncharacterized protein [Amphiura filiformis]|uniref:uncharacterized protein n=1 Tax=Amphiura filiformis TaxID=82378 RepID=UPI003B22767D
MSTDNSPDLTILTQEEYAELSKHDYPFENLVFNGGGAKCIGDIGTLKVFHDLGILPKIKRFAGTSGGALTAAFAAIGYTVEEIEEKLGGVDMNYLVTGTHGGVLGKLAWFKYAYDIARHYGALTAVRLEKWFGGMIKAKLGDPNVTFKQLYDRKDIELAITGTDVARKNVVFYHVKTTPDMPILKAMRISMSIPLIFTPEKVPGDDVGLFVDGGMLCNYPIMSYDGWYLSMDPQYKFLSEFHNDIDEYDNLRGRRFEGYNDKTVGVMVYSAYDQDVLTTELDRRVQKKTVESLSRPKTVLAGDREKEVRKIDKYSNKHREMSRAMGRLIKAVGSVTDLQTAKLTLKEFEKYRRHANHTGTHEDDIDGNLGDDIQVPTGKREKMSQITNKAISGLEGAIKTLQELKKVEDGKINQMFVELIKSVPEFQTYWDEMKQAGQQSGKDTLAILLILALQGSSEREYPLLTNENICLLIRDYSNVEEIRKDIQLMFGSYMSAKAIFDKVGKNQISFHDIKELAEKEAKDLLGKLSIALAPTSKISTYIEYVYNIIETPTFHLARALLKKNDKDRTIGINTDYLKTLDFGMEEQDRKYLIQRGKMGTVAFLRTYIKQKREKEQLDRVHAELLQRFEQQQETV